MEVHFGFRDLEDERERRKLHSLLITLLCFLAFSIIALFSGCFQPARAEGINIEKLADAIYYAEGGAKTRHPYGILTKYKTTTPRQACINTINHAKKDWNGQGDFIAFLGNRYCPIGCDNDIGTNKYWVSNVKYFYRRLR